MKSTIIKTLLDKSNSVLMFVSNLVYAEQIKLKLSKEVSISVDANIIKIGNINLNVNYNCNDALEGIASRPGGSGILFKGTFFRLNEEQNDIVILNGFSLGKYDLTHALQNKLNSKNGL